MRAQRVRVGESRAEMQFTKWTAEGAVKGRCPEYSATCGHTSVAGDMLVSRRAHGETVNQGGTAEIIFYEFTVLDRIVIFCQGLFCILVQPSDDGRRIYACIRIRRLSVR